MWKIGYSQSYCLHAAVGQARETERVRERGGGERERERKRDDRFSPQTSICVLVMVYTLDYENIYML